MKKIVFTGGGTVGHVTLNLLLIPRFLKEGWEVHYIGDKNGIEHEQIVQSGLDVTFHSIATGKLRRYFSWQNALDVFKVGFGVLQSLAILLKIRPQALFSKGGFVSVPPVIAARLTGVPVYVHESDLSMGLANKIAYRFADILYSTFEQPESLVKAKHVGAVTKVSEEREDKPSNIQSVLSLFDPMKRTILFVGGSAGAQVLNDFVNCHLVELVERYNVIQMTGDSRLDSSQKGLFRVAYAMEDYLSLIRCADVVITRGGSNTLFELLALQKLHIIVPLGHQASRGDQLENARYFTDKGYSLAIEESRLSFGELNRMIEQLLQEKQEYQHRMRASEDIQTVEHFYQLLLTDIARKDG